MAPRGPLQKELKTIRKQWNLSQADLADILGLSVATIDDWEQGRHNPSIDNLTKWAGALGYELKLELRKSR